MNKKLFLGALALVSVFTLSLSSCDNDKEAEVAKVKFDNVEIGHDNSKRGIAGKDLHIECDITSATKIKSIEAVIAQKGGSASARHTWTDARYTNVLETKFHEHLPLAANLPGGTYHFRLTVTDVNNVKKSLETDIQILGIASDAPTVKLTAPNQSSKTGVAGETLSLKAMITVKHPVEAIELEFHGAKEYPIAIEGYKGKEGTFDLAETITIPKACPAGTYHLHLTVTDSKGASTTKEVEGFVVTEKK